jgi:hypothetical protein
VRGTGGNRFMDDEAGVPGLVRLIHEGLYELRDWADDTGRSFDLAEITIETTRIPSGRISVTVSADLPVREATP